MKRCWIGVLALVVWGCAEPEPHSPALTDSTEVASARVEVVIPGVEGTTSVTRAQQALGAHFGIDPRWVEVEGSGQVFRLNDSGERVVVDMTSLPVELRALPLLPTQEVTP